MSTTSKVLCWIYAAIALAALVATWSQNLAFFAQSPDAGVAGFLRAAYANPAAASLVNDLWFLGLAALVFMVVEARRVGVRFVWLYVALSFLVAVSVTVPLFLLAREQRMSR
jgi:hypothetical protein